MSSKTNFQEMILTLVQFWKNNGCIVSQPHTSPVSAGTLNPATALRILGPEPWRTVYVETSVRPEDGRFGKSPNRLQRHHQLQVVLKPDPQNPQELFLQSLEAIGLKPNWYDIRFVAYNRQNPTLGIWGRGWEVLLNGQEIAQFTYIQHAGGQTLDPIPIEISYGLDRLAMMVQGVASVWEIQFGDEHLYSDLFHTNEVAYSRYHFDTADIDTIKAMYALNVEETDRCLANGLIQPAYKFNLQCIYLFNILVTRGAVSVTERTMFHEQIRQRFFQIAQQHHEQRRTLGFPLLDKEVRLTRPEPLPTPQQTMSSKGTQAFLLEIGTEELPGHALKSAINQLRSSVPEFFSRLNLSFSRVEVDGTPRRIAINVHLVSGEQQLADAEAREQAVPLLARHLPELIHAIRFNQDMRWNETAVSFSRPIRWLVALYGTDLIPFRFAGVVSGRTSRGIRPDRSPDIRITDAYSYAGIMRKYGITHVAEKRKDKIMVVATKLAAEKQGTMLDDPTLMDEVVNLIERPTALRGQFDAQFLQLPAELLILVMTKRQRYFPVFDDDGKLLPYFMSVRNGDEKHLDVVIEGNEMVLNARFADAEFFYQKDSRNALSAYVPRLKAITFHTGLGSMYDKTERLVKLVRKVGQLLGLSDAEIKTAVRAAALAKADLATQIVQEMGALQGVMGGHYAEKSGEPPAVAAAIAEQYTAVSQTKPGLALALTDRLDTIVGLCLIGYMPDHDNDPFRLNLMTQQLIQNLVENRVDVGFEQLIGETAVFYSVDTPASTPADILAHITQSFQKWLHEHTDSPTEVENALAHWHQSHNCFQSIQAVSR